jgi:hypothetical protein
LFLVFSHPSLPKVWPNFNLNPPSNLVVVKIQQIDTHYRRLAYLTKHTNKQQHQQTTDLAQRPQPSRRVAYRTAEAIPRLPRRLDIQPQRRVVGSSRCRRRVIVSSSRCKSTKIPNLIEATSHPARHCRASPPPYVPSRTPPRDAISSSTLPPPRPTMDHHTRTRCTRPARRRGAV